MNFVRVGDEFINMDHVIVIDYYDANEVRDEPEVEMVFTNDTRLKLRGYQAADMLAYLEGNSTDTAGLSYVDPNAHLRPDPTERKPWQEASLL